MQGGTFGAAVDANDSAWLASYGGKSIAVFDKNGKPLSPPEGITFNGQLGLMQGIIVAPNGDVWALSFSAISVGTPARLPLSTSAFFTHSRSVCAVQPILAETETIVAQRDG